MSTLGQDIRYALRAIRRAPGFTAVAVLTLALGIGANAAIFTLIDAVMIRPLPYANPDRVVFILETDPQRGLQATAASPANFVDWQRQATAFSAMAGSRFVPFNFTGNSGAVRINGAAVSANLFDLLGQRTLLGRTFLPEEDVAGHDGVIVISETLWQRQFGGDPQILGRALTMNGQRFTVVGILPGLFKYPDTNSEVWKPLGLTNAELANRSNYMLQVIGRLKDGVSQQQALAELQSISHSLELAYPQTNAGVSVRLQSLHEALVGGSRNLLLVLFAAVAMVLLIACVNLASLLSVRFLGRQHEMAIRSSLGASRGRLVLQFLTESVVLGLAGAAMGLLTAFLGLKAMLRYLAVFGLPRLAEVRINGHVLLFTLALALLCGLLFGVVPAWQSARANPVDGLREGGRGASATRSQRLFQKGLVVAEVALSLVSLVGAGLLMRSFAGMLKIDPGFRGERVMVNTLLVLPLYKYPENYQRVEFFRKLLERMRALPGVEAVGGITSLPLQGNSAFTPFRIEGRPMGPQGQGMAAVLNVVTPDYFSTMGIPLKRGRWLAESDTEQMPRVAVVNDAAIKRFFAGLDPVGQMVYLQSQGGRPYTIVGVVGSSRQFGITVEPNPEIFTNYRQSDLSYMYVLVRIAGNPESLIPSMRRVVAEIDPDQPVGQRTLMQQLDNAVAGTRVYTLLMTIFAALALALALVGIYGVASYAVSQRIHEVGVRMALGASRADVLRLFLGHGFRLSALGVLLGVGLALAITRTMATFLYHVRPTDLVTFAGAAIVLCLTVFAANFIPARRATRIDPVIALREE